MTLLEHDSAIIHHEDLVGEPCRNNDKTHHSTFHRLKEFKSLFLLGFQINDDKSVMIALSVNVRIVYQVFF